MIEIICVIIFFIGYITISLEQYTKISKTSISLLLGVILWILAFISNQQYIAQSLSESAQDIFNLVIFLLSAMTLVEILTHYGLFDFLYEKLIKLHVSDKIQFWLLTILAFLSSTVLNNLTVTIIFIQIASKFFKGKNLLKAGSAIVIAANAGGAFSPIGDVTTTMLWLSQKFTSSEIITQTFFPSLTVLLVSNFFIGKTIIIDTKNAVDTPVYITRSEWIIILLCLSSFSLPLIMQSFQLPAYFGLLLGLGIVWLAVDLLRLRQSNSTKLATSIEKFFQKTDIASIYFFIGILIAVNALRYLGILAFISNNIFGANPSSLRIISGNISIGLLSAVFDNIPLTAAAIDIVKTNAANLWTLLAFTVGVGGSLFIIGSASGIIAMTLIENLTFESYLRIATGPAALGYIMGIIVWFIQFFLSGGHV